jgi:tetratricopeptide (TPR) repeat protein
MSRETVQVPKLDKFYQQFLQDEESARFVDLTTRHYTPGTLERLAVSGSRLSRRAAVLALSFVGDFRSNEVLGHLLHDRDRAVRMLADHGLRQVWFRAGTEEERAMLRRIQRLNNCHKHALAIELAEALTARNRQLAEAWNQRAIASYCLSDYDRAIDFCQEAIFQNRYHFLAVVGMGNAFMQLDNVSSALESFRLALDINPDLENIRGQVTHLEKILGE